MASPPPSPNPQAAPSPSAITGGAISGTLPAAEAFAVHYPGYPSSPARAARTLGGLPAIAKARSSDPGVRLEVRFRPEDPYCHLAFGESSASTGLVLRLSRRKGGSAAPRADVVARVRTVYHFEGKTGRLEADDGAVLMLIPPLFSLKDKPTNIAPLPSSNAISKSMQRGVIQDKWEGVVPSHKLPLDIQAVPGKINWEDHVSKNTVYWDWQMAVCKLFDERPIWPRQLLYERLHDDAMHVSQNQFRRLLFRAGYYFSTGPFRKLWIKRGYDPRKDPESRIYQVIDFRMPHELRPLQREKDHGSQKQTELCKLEALPSKSSIYLQLFELKDDFIQAEIRKPSYRSTFSRDTGWFSKHMIKTLRLQLSIRLLSLCPNEDTKILLRNAYELIERSKKQEAICRSEQSKEESSVDEEAPAIHTGIMDQVGDSSDSEDVVDEEEEDKEESDGYDSPATAVDVGDFTLEDSYALGDFSNGYLEEVLRSFPAREDDQNRPGDAANDADATDEEFEIYEQSSDDEEYSDGS